MRARKVTDGVQWVGSVDWNRRVFDELIPLPDGTSYNSYLLSGSAKTALVETVDPSKTEEWRQLLDAIPLSKLDYVIANHAEQDHSGSIPYILSRFPDAKLVCTPKAKGLLTEMLHVADERFVTVADGETLSLGDMTLEFIHAAWVHWPETMLTYIREKKVLLPCDLFGSHLATPKLFMDDPARAYRAAKRYYAEIMMPFRTNIEKHLERLAAYDIDIIAPSHGPLYSKPAYIMGAYRDWVSGPLSNKVVIPYVSMHGSTQVIVDRLIGGLAQMGVQAVPHYLTGGDTGRLAMELVDAATVVLGTPTVLAGAHPQVAYAAFLANALRPRLMFASIVGSFGWGGRAVEQLVALVPNLKVELLAPVLIKGLPLESDLESVDKLAALIAEKHRGAGLA